MVFPTSSAANAYMHFLAYFPAVFDTGYLASPDQKHLPVLLTEFFHVAPTSFLDYTTTPWKRLLTKNKNNADTETACFPRGIVQIGKKEIFIAISKYETVEMKPHPVIPRKILPYVTDTSIPGGQLPHHSLDFLQSLYTEVSPALVFLTS